jgi:hypothetical protein
MTSSLTSQGGGTERGSLLGNKTGPETEGSIQTPLDPNEVTTVIGKEKGKQIYDSCVCCLVSSGLNANNNLTT